MSRKLSFKQWLIAFPFFLLFIGTTLFLYSRNHEDGRFRAFAESFLLSELKSNPINFHYSVENAERYHIDEASLTLPVYAPGQAEYDAAGSFALTEQLADFDPEKLSDDNRRLYILLSGYLNAAKAVASYPYFAEPLSPSSGAPSQIPILLAEYRLDSPEDIENYLSILTQIPDYFEGLIVYEKEKAEAGLFMADDTADKVIRECMDLMDPKQLDDQIHFLEVTFLERLERLRQADILTQDQLLSYQSENERLLKTVVAPAYDSLADEITILKGNGKPVLGLAHYPSGREYYTALIRLQTGSDRTVAEIKALLYEDLKKNYNTFLTLMQNNPSLQKAFTQEPAYLPDMTPEEMLSYLRTQIEEDYPAIPQVPDGEVECTIKYVDECLEPYTAPAFYMIPPIDNVSDNTIYINALDTSDDLSLFTTLAHEGYPGHLYQTVYNQRYLAANDISPLCSTLYYGGFIEGWAMYVELESYAYAAQLAARQYPEAADYYLACRLDRQIQLCLYSLLDVAIHYDGASLEDVREIFSSLGSLDEGSIRSIYEYIAENPSNYLKYYLGYIEILELKKQAATLWSSADRFDTACADSDFLYRFHTFLMQNGPADFKTLSVLLLQQKESR